MPPKDKQKPITADPVVAEAAPDSVQLAFEWRGHAFTVSPQDFEYGRALFAVRLATNVNRDFDKRLNSMIDAFEAIIGQEQLEVAMRLEPHLLDNPDHVHSFFDALSSSVAGGSLGE